MRRSGCAAVVGCPVVGASAVLLVATAPSASAQTQPNLQVPPVAQASPAFDPARATDAYLATVPPDKKARSDAYFEGGYWLQLWNVLYGTIVLWALLMFGWSAAMRDRAERMTLLQPLQTLIYCISLNDNLLRRAPIEEIEAVLGHEIGHYVLNHRTKNLFESSLVVAIGFALVGVGFERLRRRHGEWRIASVGDVAGLPLIAVLFSVYSFVATPINNTIVRETEYEADMFGLNASRRPDGFANAALKLGEYRKLAPGPVEEFVFFDHPSGRTRIYSAMRWKAENLN